MVYRAIHRADDPLNYFLQQSDEGPHLRVADIDVHGIAYLRHVRGLALDQINELYNHNTVDELCALYLERIAKRHNIPMVPEIAEDLANFFKSRDESVLRFVCSGLVQYSFFETL